MRISEAIEQLSTDNHIGLYFVFIHDFDFIQREAPCFANDIIERRVSHPELDWTLIYIGEAKGTGKLYKRFRQEFLQETRGTFFRSIGAATGENPRLAHTTREIKNYIFKDPEKNNIIDFMEKAFSVCYLYTDDNPDEADDRFHIKCNKPVVNIKHNPLPSQFIIDQRKRCRRISAGQTV